VAAPPRGRFDAGRTGAGIALLCLAAAAAAVLGVGSLSARAPHKPPSSPPPISDPQARSLAAMRYGNQLDGRVAIHADLGSPGTGVRIGGWIDWQRQLVYLASVAATPGPADGLLQAVPGLIAVHAGRPADTPPSPSPSATPGGYPMPPATPPVDGWRLRPLDPTAASGAAFDELVATLFALASDRPDDAAQLAGSGARFLRRDTVSTVPVSVFTAPPRLGQRSASPMSPESPSASPSASPLPPVSPSASPSVSPLLLVSPSAPAAAAGPATYWLDDNARLRRLDAVLGGGLPMRVDFDRGERSAPAAIALLGGAPVQPRAVTADEAKMLAELPVRDRAARGGQVTLAVPVGGAGLVEATGWLDWRTPAAYLALRDLDDPGAGTLLRADRTGVTSRGAGSATAPPLKPPADGWTQSTWGQRADNAATVDVDTLLTTALNLGSGTRGDPSPLHTTASWLRTDAIDAVPVTVFEIRGARETVPGQARLRYWVDRDGVLRRLEVRTAGGGYGRLDLTPGAVPVLPKPTPGR
jgi:hypothetical protein